MAKPDGIADAARGIFITFEGGEGSGKSTQIKRLAARLGGHHARVVMTREPGGSAGAEVMRHLILSGAGKALGAEGETLLFAAARDDHVRTLIAPALACGNWVLCDRFADSTRVYQGSAGHVPDSFINALNRATIGSLQPDLTFVLDLDAEIGLSRAALRRGKDRADRFEAEDIAFHRGLRDAYRALAQRAAERCVLIDAEDSIDSVEAAIWAAMVQRWPHLGAAPAEMSA